MFLVQMPFSLYNEMCNYMCEVNYQETEESQLQVFDRGV